MRILLWLTVVLLFLAACEDGEKKAAVALLNQAERQFESKDYQAALNSIDSLRHLYPTAIEERKRALRLKQEISLRQAQDDLALTDSALQIVIATYEYQRELVERKKAALCVTKEELDRLNQARTKRDSLQVRFDVQCAKIRYIHKKQKEDM